MSPSRDASTIPTRPLGRTGHSVTLFALDGEGVLRTHGRTAEAAAVIERALDFGVNYCDTAPAYSSSMDYYGVVLGERRKEIFLASKTPDRTRDGSLRILDDSLRRLRTDHLDLCRVLGEPRYTNAARRAASFLLETLQRDGRLLHRYRNGDAAINAYLDDYAFLVLGLLDLYEATFEARWLGEAKRFTEEMVRLFWDDDGKGFRFSGQDNERLIARTKKIYDRAIPSGNSVATLALLKVGRLTMDRDLEKLADEDLTRFSGKVDQFPMGYPFMLMALDFAVGPSKEVVLAGAYEEPNILAMRRAIYRRFLPNVVIALHPTGKAAEEIEALVPFLKEQRALDGKCTAYVCENYACNLPTTDVAIMLKSLLPAESGR